MSIERNSIDTGERATSDGWRDPQAEQQARMETTEPDMERIPDYGDRRDDEDTRRTESTPYLPEQTSAQTGERWQHIQSDFVDDPRKAVNEAHELVSEVMRRVVDTFTHERDDLERQWSGGDDVSTENLRLCMQRYRAFFTRLLPIEEESRNAH